MIQKLSKQKDRVAHALQGGYYTLEEAKWRIYEEFKVRDMETAISARFRDLKRTGKYTCYKRRRIPYRYLWEYRVELVR
ncbi:hypothetical protein [Algicola sagamiensis]|uniref:hypothetical protein n=1 Tax=Algicola sagamiensis TaxID=163869 RepID=UPI00037A9707|nr:hypothetical protein [Algicola sagamiensis]